MGLGGPGPRTTQTTFRSAPTFGSTAGKGLRPTASNATRSDRAGLDIGSSTIADRPGPRVPSPCSTTTCTSYPDRPLARDEPDGEPEGFTPTTSPNSERSAEGTTTRAAVPRRRVTYSSSILA